MSAIVGYLNRHLDLGGKPEVGSGPGAQRLPALPRACTLALHAEFVHHRMHMAHTTLNVDQELLEKAKELTGVSEKTSLVRLGLEALVARESARRLAALGGSEKHLRAIPRRRPKRLA